MARADKPVDVGTGVVCASFGADAAWLSIGCLHPTWGFVELSGLPPFDEAGRGDADATRRYRRLMTDPGSAWLRLEPVDRARLGELHDLSVSTADPERPCWSMATGRVAADAYAVAGSRWVVQRWRLDPTTEWRLRVTGRIDRPALAEITEVNPPPPTGAVTEVHAAGGRLVLRAPALPAVAVVEASAGTWSTSGGGAELRIGPRIAAIELSVLLAPDRDPPESGTPAIVAGDAPPCPTDPVVAMPSIDSIIARALSYVRSCTALQVAPGERAILTDHRLLPLSWTRDAYYQALLLQASGRPDDQAIVADHLRWLWRRCDRPDGRWMRSHHGNGRPKDLVYQADQQLYPFVELADTWRATGSLPPGVDWERVVPRAWRAVLDTIDPATGLIATEENAADDRVDAPFVGASQILLWYCAMRFSEPGLATRTGLRREELLACARSVRAAFDRHLVVGGRWAYTVDGHGRSVAYHDANDLPTILAAVWGFCAADDPAWRSTVAFAFSPENPGFVPGPDGGLGSAHTPGVWPLGDVQAWLVGRLQGDEAVAHDAARRIQRAAFDDGMLAEAIVRHRAGSRPVRHWFAWPGAAFAAFWLLDRAGSLDRLAVKR